MAPPPLTIHLFGPLRVTVAGESMPRVRTRSVEWLLALLTLRHGSAVSRSWLAGTLWPESSGSQALENLRADLVRLRKALGPESSRLQSPARDSLTLDLTGAVVDVLQFDRAIQAGDEESLQGAVAVYTAPLLEGCLEEWAFTERTARAEQLLTALETLAERTVERGEHEAAIRYLRRAEALDPLRDTLPRRLMSSLAAAGDPAAAIQTYRDFRLRLQEELAAAPDEETTRLFHEIRAATRHQAVQRRLVPTRTSEPETGDSGLPHPVPEPLPRALTSLIGREQELEEVRAALQQSALVTLVGGGGVGKTRLALEVARQVGVEAVDGAAWVELAPLADGTVVLAAVAAALGLRDAGSASDADALMRRLVTRLADGAPLLVLDNCEHLLDAVAALVQPLLQRCSALRILATSRQRLGLPGEVTWRVPSLPAPDPEQLPKAADAAVAAALGFAAVRLFVERAGGVQPGFRLAGSVDAAAVGQICRRLDGIPLAIELAAARTRVLTPQQIATRLDDRFRLLTRGTRGALPRHQTLRALIDWSYDSLPAAEAALLRRLSVFAGGWTLEAAEAVAGVGSWELGVGSVRDGPLSPPTPNSQVPTPDEVLDLLDGLVDQSLVLVDAVAGGLRYRMLETVRQYARDRLLEAGEAEAVQERHRDWFLMLAEEAEQGLGGESQTTWLDRLEVEHDNLRAALVWCGTCGQGEAGLRLGGALGRFWERRGYYWTEGRAHLAGLLALPEAATRTAARGRALNSAGTLARFQGDPVAARVLLEESLAIFRELENKEDIAWSLRSMANLAHDETEYGRARAPLEESLAIFRELGNKRGIAYALNDLGWVVRAQGDYEAARALLEESLAIWGELVDKNGLANSLLGLAHIAQATGDSQKAKALLEEGVALIREIEDRWARIHPLGGVAHLARDLGDHRWATALYQESLRLRREVGDRFALAQSLEDLAVVAGRQGRARRVARLLGAVESQCAAMGASPPVADPTLYDRTVTAARGTLGEETFAAAWAEGRAMSLDQAVEYALGAP
jgi:predicted ATPase/DNA-binding SARP family transcriptional activator